MMEPPAPHFLEARELTLQRSRTPSGAAGLCQASRGPTRARAEVKEPGRGARGEGTINQPFRVESLTVKQEAGSHAVKAKSRCLCDQVSPVPPSSRRSRTAFPTTEATRMNRPGFQPSLHSPCHSLTQMGAPRKFLPSAPSSPLSPWHTPQTHPTHRLARQTRKPNDMPPCGAPDVV